MSQQDKHLYEFGPFRLDTSERLLLRGGARVPLTEKAFDTLAALVRRSGHLASKDELMAEVWPGAFVEENNLDKSISAIRQALGEKSSEVKYVETVRGRGYRFVAGVSEVRDEPADPTTENYSWTQIAGGEEASASTVAYVGAGYAKVDGAPTVKPFVRSGKSTTLALIVVAVAVGVSVLSLFWLTRRAKQTGQTGPPPAVRSLAVLPFKPLAAYARDESLELGMADTLITKLGAIREVSVRPVSAVRRYTSLEQDPGQAGRELGVEAVLDGSIQRSGERVRATARLVRVSDGRQLWSGQFDERFTDIFAVQDSISERVARSLAPRLSGEEERRLAKRDTENTAAYEPYLKGRHFLRKGTEETTRKSIGYFGQAIAIDPEYALAHSGLADAYNSLAFFNPAAGVNSLQQAKAAALKALAIDDTLAEAHTSLGVAKQVHDLDFAGAEREYKRAIELNPDSASAHYRYGNFLMPMRRYDEADAEFKRALQLDPLSLPINADAGRLLYVSGQYDRAVEQLRKTIDLDPNFPRARRLLAYCYTKMSKYEEAIAEAQKAVAVSGPTQRGGGLPRADHQLTYIYAKAGRVREARQMLDELERPEQWRNTEPYFTALAYNALGDRERTFVWLERLYEIRSHNLLGLNNDPSWDDLRGDPLFQDLRRRIGLSP